MEYTAVILKFGEFPHLSDQKRDVIFVGRIGHRDVCVRFFCPCPAATPIYIPFGKHNNEGGGGVRTIEWLVKDKVLSLKPSIRVKGACNCHFHITENKSV